ncbi:MAG: hypothetical protein BGO25_04430 [Acidobacteriales bacterium 59-55]|nr:hypothetical protein [Terriglobales bacterium]OJV40381.1 MAG: hypothetical protein BGO25_04430 [Acidobacteriales bacterium 59-55]
MRQRFGSESRRPGTWLVLFAVALLTVSAMAFAQDEMPGGMQNGRGGASFAGGRMVRGTVTAVAPDRLTVKTEEGEVYQVVLSDNTRVMKQRQPIKAADIKAGDGVGAMGVMDAPAKTVHAVLVAVVDAEQVRKAREDLGKTYITGTVTAIDMDNARLTVKRPDGVSQTIQADEGTSFRRGGRRAQAAMNGSPMNGNAATASGTNTGGESITLADVKTGEMVGGQGALKNGVFVPTELRVMDMAARGQGRRRAAANSAAASPETNAPASPR